MDVRRCALNDVGILGLAFKSGSDDLRNSPSLRLAAHLHHEGFSVRAYNPDEEPGTLSESNRRVLERLLPHYDQILRPSLEAVLASSSLIIITQRRPELTLTPEMLKDYDVKVLDLIDPASTWATPSGDRACNRASTIEIRNSSAGA